MLAPEALAALWGNMVAPMESYFATCPRGLESILALELESLGAVRPAVVPGGVEFSGTPETCYRANLESRVASRILWRVRSTSYASEDDVYRVARAVPWARWFGPHQTLRVQVSAIQSPLRSLDFATLRIKDAVCDRFRDETGQRPSIDTQAPDVRVHAFLTRGGITLYLDTSGEALFKRGWRRTALEAPLRENLAAGILRLAGWAPGIPLLDPMCGSGTFLQEAAMMALDMAPGLGRRFAFERLQNFDRGLWESVRGAAQSRRAPPAPAAIHGSDSDPRALEASRENLQAAGLAQVVALECRPVLDTVAPAREGVLVTNPPYGLRVGDEQALAALYPELGNVLKRRFAGWRACILTADRRLPTLIRLKPSRRTPLYNGAIECRLYEFKLIAGSMKKGRDSAAPSSPAG